MAEHNCVKNGKNISKSSYRNKLSGPTVPKYWTPRATLGVRKQIRMIVKVKTEDVVVAFPL